MLNKVTGCLLLIAGGVILCFMVMIAPQMDNGIWKLVVSFAGAAHIVGGVINVFKWELDL